VPIARSWDSESLILVVREHCRQLGHIPTVAVPNAEPRFLKNTIVGNHERRTNSNWPTSGDAVTYLPMQILAIVIFASYCSFSPVRARLP